MTEVVPHLPSEAIDALWRYFGAPAEAPDGLKELAERFVELKRGLGYKYEGEHAMLRRFIEFLAAGGIERASQISAGVVHEWAESRREAAPRAFANQVRRVAVFLDHLKVIEKLGENPLESVPRHVPRDGMPYIFSRDELARIFRPSRSGPLEEDRALVWRFIYACGLRCQEAAHLLIREFDVPSRTVFVRKTKFSKDRLVPLHPSIAARLAEYLARRRAGASAGETVFVRYRRPYRPSALGTRFREHLLRLGIYRPAQDRDGVRYLSPSLHSLRHCFAVYRLLKWYRDGAAVQAKLPLLSTYLGHVDPVSTQVYLKITALLLREAAARFSAHLERALPLKP
jgi:integrase